MIVKIGSGSTGWSEYVLGVDENREGAKLIMGDTELGDRISASTDYSTGNYYRLVVSFYDDLPEEKAQRITKEFLQKFMHGFSGDEYHVDVVQHTDTDHLHYHVRIPKLNLLTGTQLQLYMHSADKKRKQLIVDDICQRHGLTHADDLRKPIKVDRSVERINKWRESQGKPAFKFDKKKGRDAAQNYIINYIDELHNAGLINTLDDVRAAVQELGLEITKEDYDRSKEFHYFTVENDTGKIRLKGEIFDEGFWRNNSREDRGAALKNDRSARSGFRRDTAAVEKTRRELEKELVKRERAITKRYGSARKRAKEEARKISERMERGDNPGVEKRDQPEQVDPHSLISRIEPSPWGIHNMDRATKDKDRGNRNDGKRVDHPEGDEEEIRGREIYLRPGHPSRPKKNLGNRRKSKREIHQNRREVNDGAGATINRRAREEREARARALRELYGQLKADQRRVFETQRNLARSAREREERAFSEVERDIREYQERTRNYAIEGVHNTVKNVAAYTVSLTRDIDNFVTRFGERIAGIKENIRNFGKNLERAVMQIESRIEEVGRGRGYGRRR